MTKPKVCSSNFVACHALTLCNNGELLIIDLLENVFTSQEQISFDLSCYLKATKLKNTISAAVITYILWFSMWVGHVTQVESEKCSGWPSDHLRPYHISGQL